MAYEAYRDHSNHATFRKCPEDHTIVGEFKTWKEKKDGSWF